MINQLEKKRNYYGIFMIVNVIFFFLMHLTFVGFTNDETYFMVYMKDFNSLFDIIVDRYNTDSSRVLSEGILFFLLDKPFIMWQILDTLMCVIIFHSLSVILVNDKFSKNNILIFMAFAAYPYMHVGSAGWICTSLNYLWPTATILYALTGVFRRARGEKIKAWQYVLYVIALVFTANTEMSAVEMFLLFGVAVFFAIKDKRSKGYEIAGIIIGIVGIIFALTAPGNGERTLMESRNWMPEFPELSLFDKFRLCSVFVFEHFVAIPDILFILFAVVIAIKGFKKGQGLLRNAVCLTPCIITGIFTVYYGVIYIANVISGYKAGLGIKINYDFTTPVIYPTELKDILTQYIELACFYIFIVASVAAIIMIVRDMKYKVASIAGLGAGFAVRMALMLSPTMFSSWHRTLIFMYFGFIFATITMITKTDSNEPENEKSEGSHNWTKGLIYGILIVGILVNLVLTVGLQIRKG